MTRDPSPEEATASTPADGVPHLTVAADLPNSRAVRQDVELANRMLERHAGAHESAPVRRRLRAHILALADRADAYAHGLGDARARDIAVDTVRHARRFATDQAANLLLLAKSAEIMSRYTHHEKPQLHQAPSSGIDAAVQRESNLHRPIFGVCGQEGSRPVASLRNSDSQEAQHPMPVEQLRNSMVGELRDLGAIHTDRVETAFRTVPRHLFVPEVSASRAYAAEDAVITKTGGDGINISSVSAARIQAFMLEQADIHPGMNVLEIGSGGLNAAYIAELVGPGGKVTTADIDPDVTDRANRCLGEAGYDRVNVVLTDGENGAPGHDPYDRIIVTVGAWDIPPAWLDQLTDDGRIVVPLRVRGLTRSVALAREGDRMVSRGYELCGFVPMQGAGEHRVRLAVLHDEKDEEIGLRLDDGQRVDTGPLRAALSQPRAEAWSAVTIGGMEPFDDLDLWLATVVPDFALLAATAAAREKGLVASASPLGVPTLVDGDSFAYRTARPLDEERTRFEFGAYGHGPAAQKAADRLVELVQTWDREQRAHHARFTVQPASEVTPSAKAGGVLHSSPAELIVRKRHTRVTVSWPQPNADAR